MKSFTTIILIVLVFYSLPVLSQDMDQLFIQDVENFIEKIMSTYEIPGVAIGVIKNGQIYYTRGFGVKNIETKEPVSESTIFHMASVSKPFVATAIMQWQKPEKLSSDNPVVYYLPYFKINDPRYMAITVKQMLTHTSGMPDVLDYEWGQPEEPAGALTRYTKSLTNEQSIAAPGEKWQYSNMAYDVLGNLIEQVSGLSFEEYISQNMLDPLDMKQSSFLIDESLRHLYTDGHIRQLSIEVSRPYPYNPKHAPSSTLHSNAVNMCHWAIADYINRGQYENRHILDASAYNLLWHPYSTTNSDDQKIGLSWFLSEQNGRMKIYHGGGDLGFSTHFSMEPETKTAVVVLTNHDYSPVQAMSDGIWAMLAGHKPKMPKTPILIVLSKIMLEHDVQTAIKKYEYLKKNQPNDFNFSEAQLNILGYNLMSHERLNDAIEIFKLNVKAFPSEFQSI